MTQSTPEEPVAKDESLDPFWEPSPDELEAAPRHSRFPALNRLVRTRTISFTPSQLRLIHVVVFLSVAAVLLYYYKPGLLFSRTTTAGGDTGAHIYGVWFAREELLPRGYLTGWSHGWLGGVPMLHFYFPLVIGLQALLSYVIPFQIAFKLGTVAGPFLFPLGAFAMFRSLGFRAPTPHIAALLSLGFLLMDSYTIYGGNLASTLAGEYSFTVSLALSLFFIGMVYRIVLSGGGHPIAAAAVLAAVVLSHVLPALMVLPVLPLLLYWGIRDQGWRRTTSKLLTVGGLAFLFTAFWSLPMITRIHYTTSFNIAPLEGWAIAQPGGISVPTFFLAIACGAGIMRRDRRVAVLITPGLVGLALYFIAPEGLVWNARWLPFWYLSTFLATAYVLGTSLPTVARLAWRRRATLLATGISVAISLSVVGWAVWKHGRTFTPGWIEHNYKGYENQPAFQKFRNLHERLEALPPGRVTNEDSAEIAEFGSAFAFMTLPYWIQRPSLEGLYFESSLTTPYLIMLQTEMSEAGPHTIPGLPYHPFDLDIAAQHMRMLDVRYYIAVTDAAQNAADTSDAFELIEEIEDYSIYEVTDQPGTVYVPDYEPVVVEEDNWRPSFLRWWAGLRDLEVPLVREGPERWARTSTGEDLPRIKLPEGGRSYEADLSMNRIEFDTTAVGEPHYVKVSYFPNWKVEGAEGPFLASPSMMMVIPTQKDVVLTYERTWIEWTGLLFTGMGLLLIVLPATRRRIRAA